MGFNKVGMEKTEENWILNKLALVTGSWIILWPSCKSEIPTLSLFLLLIYDQSFLLSLSSPIKSWTYDSWAFLQSFWQAFFISLYLALTFSHELFFRFNEPPLFLTKNTLCFCGNPGLVRSWGTEFGRDVIFHNS